MTGNCSGSSTRSGAFESPRTYSLPPASTRPMRRILLIDDEAWFRKPAALMLLDLMMPGMSGLTFLRLIRADERFAALVVVVLSAWADGQPGTDALALGAKACLVKGSFSLLDLTEQLEMLA